MDRRTALALMSAAVAAGPALAAPKRYALDVANSKVAFSYILNGSKMTGRAPVRDADIVVDVDRPSRSEVGASLDMSKANAGVFFATQAMKGAQVLDTKRFPTVRFQSEKITGSVNSAKVTGKLTIRDVTRTETFNAQLFRQRGTVEGDRSRLSIQLTGEVDRRLYGADGFLNFVGPMIGLDILTRIDLV